MKRDIAGHNALLVDLYELTMAQSYFFYRRGGRATFELFVRDMPPRRSYLVACGLETALAYLKELRFTGADIAYLRSLGLFSGSFLRFLASFRFRGEVWAMPEGTVFFPGEPVIRVTGSNIEAQLVESFLLNTFNLQTLIAGKAARVVAAARGKPVYDFSLRRTHGRDAGINAARSSFVAGAAGTSNCLAGRMYGIPVAGTMAHSFVMSFENELDAFVAYCNTFPGKTVLLVDTYAVAKGIEHAVTAGLLLKKRGYRLQGIRLDSGDIVALSRAARRRLDAAGLEYVRIMASGNLDEYKIEKLLAAGAAVDSFGVGTSMGTSSDAPSIDCIYKLCEVAGPGDDFRPAMKLSSRKVTLPGRKQVFRFSSGGRFSGDRIGLQGERCAGEPLLREVLRGGRQVLPSPPLEAIRARFRDQLRRFDPRIALLRGDYRYPVGISDELRRLRDGLSRSIGRPQ